MLGELVCMVLGLTIIVQRSILVGFLVALQQQAKLYLQPVKALVVALGGNLQFCKFIVISLESIPED